MIDLSNYSCDKCVREFSRHCKHCYHTADKVPTRFKKKKKTGCETPEFRRPAMPPVAKPKEERCVARTVRRSLVGTKDSLDALLSRPDYADSVKIENADVYWSDKNGATIVATTPEWRDYLLGKRDTPVVEKENQNA